MEGSQQGVITIIEELMHDMTVLMSEIQPIIEKTEPVDTDAVRTHFNLLVEKMKGLTEKTNLTYVLIQGVINSIHSSRSELQKSVDGLLKKTGIQLKKITTTTEEATNKILDVAERLDADQLNIIEKLDSLKTITDPQKTDGLIEEIKQMVYRNQDAAFTIIDYLQFQDITAQQISGAYALLSDTEKTLIYVSNLLKEFDADHDIGSTLLPEIDPRSFNADAMFRDKGTLQSQIDDLFNTGNTDVNIEQEDHLDDLKDFVPTKKPTVDDEDFDIDALFNNNKKSSSDEKASQDDIDKLFQ